MNPFVQGFKSVMTSYGSTFSGILHNEEMSLTSKALGIGRETVLSRGSDMFGNIGSALERNSASKTEFWGDIGAGAANATIAGAGLWAGMAPINIFRPGDNFGMF